MSLKIGDIVTLNSGSPPLTVTDVHRHEPKASDTVDVTWIGDNDVIQRANFPVACVRTAMSAPTVPDDVARLRMTGVNDTPRSTL